MSMMGELNFFLGLQIKQLKEGTFINQEKYIRDLPKRFNMEEAKTMKTPMSSSIKLDKDEKGKFIDSTIYRGMIGSLLYLTASRPDIMYSICLCARFQSCPKESHLSAVKRILRYLKGTMDMGLWYPKSDNFELIGFSDAHFAGCRVERKSTSGTFHFLEHSLVSWHSKMQNSVALSTVEVEYIAAGPRASDLGRLLLCPHVTGSFSTFPMHLGFQIISTVRGVEIQLDPESICHILDIALVGLMVYESKAWPTMPGRWIHVGYLMMMRMISYYESTTHVLPYGLFLTRVFKDVKSEGVHFEALFPEPMMSELTYTVGPSSQPSFTKLPYTEPSPHQAPHAPDHAPWMDLSTRISSLGTRMEELTVFSDTRF
uniref:Retrovirus-related Pol polyprotein from transposon RE1 n=1 Tax=Vitis vinifera TaxID=29760 RepID=A5AMA4_VITVI|nr:hypothetical protein VITISV_036606 [Vitis vinifera]